MRYAKLKGKMAECNMSQLDLANKVGISLSTMNAKMNDNREFTIKEAKIICDVLGITDPKGYFFVNKIPNMQRKEVL